MAALAALWSAAPSEAQAVVVPAGATRCVGCLGTMRLPAGYTTSEALVYDPADGELPAFNPSTGAVNAFFRSITLTNVAAGMDVANVAYPGWCGDLASTTSGSGRTYVASTYGALPPYAGAQGANWSKVNYILNHKQGLVKDVQRAIWVTLGSPNNIPASAASEAMILAASAQGAFVPGPGQVVAVLLNRHDLNPTYQNLLIEVPVPNCGSIGDVVWHDQNRDGLQSAGEPGINGVTVNLRNPSGALVCSAVTTTSSTAVSGYYLFTNLEAGDYSVEVAATPAGYQPAVAQTGYPANAATDSNGSPAPVTLATRGASDYTIDFGYITPCTGTIGDYVWNDANRNGIQDAGEGWIQNVRLTLFTSSGTQVGNSVLTDSLGAYRFTGVCAGSYSVVVDASTLPANYSATPANALGSTSLNDSNGSPATVILNTDASADASIDFGYAAPCTGTIGNLTWHDQNRNGIQDAGEPGLVGVGLRLLQGTTVLQTLSSAATPGGGYYQFGGLCAGTYTVEVASVPSGYKPTAVGASGSTGENDSNATPSAVTLGTNDGNQTVDFGFDGACNGAIGDFVWHDANRNGIQDAGEAGIAGVRVNLKNPTDNTVIISTLTNAQGVYSFGARCTGNYLVEAIAPTGWASSAAGAGSPAVDSNPNPAAVTLANDLAQDLTIDFGFYPGALGDRVWLDSDGDGVQDAGETGLSGWTVTISGATLPAGYAATQVTGPDGLYSFAGLPAATYSVCVTPMSGYTQTYDLDGIVSPNCSMAALAAGQVRTDVDFGYKTPSQIAVCGLTWGYWKNHVEKWPVSALTLGSRNYTQAELIALFGMPVAGDVSISLAHQLIAAKLNVSNGTPVATANGAITAADALLAGFPGKLPYKVASGTAVGQQMVAVSANLDFFNSDGAAQPGCVSSPGPGGKPTK